jgi:hypothetical protein
MILSRVDLRPVAVDIVDLALQRNESTFRSPRMLDADDTDALAGMVYWKPGKSLWISAMTATTFVGAPLTFTWGALALFVVTTAVTVCLGHSLGMHRRLIHRSYDCPLWLERLFVYLGTLVGMAGPYGMIRQHDIRDWAQRKARCHPYLAHRSSILHDAYWQLHCDLVLAHPPALVIERKVRDDRFYQFIDRTFMAQQLPWALLFLALGGMPWLVWGIAVRVFASGRGIGSSGTLPTIAGRARGTSRAPACRATTCPIAGLSRWVRVGTTTIMPSRAQHGSGSATTRSIRAGGCSPPCGAPVWCGT